MEGLSLDNIFTAEEAELLFAEEEQQEPSSEDKGDSNPGDNKDIETTEVDPESLFDEDEPESVGSGDNKDKEDTNSNAQGSTSPDFYSSIAKALTEEGIFPDLDDDTISNVKTPEDFRDLVEKQIQAGLDERQKRIDDALNAGVEPTEIKKYEGTISYLESITEKKLEDDSEEGQNLRNNLIYQDFVNRGYSKERAAKEVQKSIKSGSDIEDAKEALISNREFFQEKYDTLVKEAKD